MNKYFTKEYIKECDCEEIQNLRSDEWEMGDFMYYKSSGEIDVMHPKLDNGSPIWLPTGDQLDEEIVKICKKNKWDYQISHYHNGLILCWINPNCINYSAACSNPLIAKIRLLKELLK